MSSLTIGSYDDENKDLWSTVVPQTSRSDRGDIRRCFDPHVHPELGMDGCLTLYEGFRRGCELNPLGPCLGFRAVSASGMPTPYIYSSYSEILARVDAFAAGLDALDLLSRNDEGLIVLSIYMKNCMEWVIAEHGAYCLGGATAALYDTLGPQTVRFILSQTLAKSVVCSRAELKKVCEAKQSGDCGTFQYAILVDGVTPEASKMAVDAGVEVISFAKVEAKGAQLIATAGHKHSPPSGDDVAFFCYTSGTTGNPKGALLTHTNVISAGVGISHVFEADISDRHLSYLPLAHIFERVVMSGILMKGASAAFFRGNPLWLVEDLQACRPTIMPVAPRVLNKIYDKIMNGINQAGGLKKRLFMAGLRAKTDGLAKGRMKHTLYDNLLFNKVKKALGLDCLRMMVSGSAPLSSTVMTFFRCVLGVPVVEGYGQTEGAAAATVSHPNDCSTVGHVGGPAGSVEIVLIDVPEMGYLHTDTDHRGKPCQGRGEICIRGPSVFKGYYKDPEKTRETIDQDGWLHSGDIGLWTMEGALQIIDRKKNIFKLSQGEYVAPEKIENILIGSRLIGQCFVYGDSLQHFLVAVVVPDEEPVKAWAQQHEKLANKSFADLCKSPQLKIAIMADIEILSSEGGLHGFEMVKDICLEPDLFSVEEDLITPTFKLKRQKLRDHFVREIEEMYSLLGSRSKL